MFQHCKLNFQDKLLTLLQLHLLLVNINMCVLIDTYKILNLVSVDLNKNWSFGKKKFFVVRKEKIFRNSSDPCLTHTISFRTRTLGFVQLIIWIHHT